MKTAKSATAPAPKPVHFPAGRYYVGDPCYVVPEKDWSAVCDALDAEGFSGALTINGHKAFAASTMYGDGGYSDGFGFCYFVDSGLIGCVPIAACDPEKIAHAEKIGRFATFKKPFSAVRYDNGTFHIGRYWIDTGALPDFDDGDDDDAYDAAAVQEWAQRTCDELRVRAQQEGVPFDLTPEYLVSIAPTHCPVTGARLDYSAGNAPTIGVSK